MRKDKSTIKALLFGAILMLLVIAIFNSCMKGSNDIEGAEPVEQEVVAEEKETEADKEAAKAKAQEERAQAKAEIEKSKEAQSLLENEALVLLQDSFEGTGIVTFDKGTKAYAITSTDPAFMEEVLLISQGQLPMDNWYALLDSMVFLSESIQGALGQGYTVVMVNPSNTDRILITAQDGIITYDVMEESI